MTKPELPAQKEPPESSQAGRRIKAVLRSALRVFLWSAGVLIVLLIAATVLSTLVILKLGEGLCDNTPIAEYPSPEGRRRVLVFERSCGATTGFSTQASLLDADEDLDIGSGNLFISDTDHGAAPSGPGGGPELSVEWKDERSLVLVHDSRVRVFKSEQRMDGVHVSYRHTPRWGAPDTATSP